MSFSELMELSFDKLYKKYDMSSDPAEKQLIQSVVEAKEPDEDSSFQAYPEYSHSDFQKIIFEKKEFNSNQLFLDSSATEDPCTSDFSIKPHQIVLKNFMNKESPYRSLLVYHGVGVGKTCSGLTIAENFRDTYARNNRRILILCSKNIQIGWKKTIYSPEKGSNQCTGDSFTNTDAKTPRQINKLTKQYYEIMAYQSFSNFVKRKQNEYVRKLPDDKKEQGKKEWFNEYFSGRLVIIDEAHNIRDDQGKELRDAVQTIENMIKYSDELRLVLLTATPMYNRASEIIWMLNMMLLNDKRQTIDAKGVFKHGELTEQGKQLIYEKSKGYISYLRGENPISFPLRITPKYLKNRNNDTLFPNYSKQHQKSIIDNRHSPKFNYAGGTINRENRFKFLELLGSKMNGLQEVVYTTAINEIIEARGRDNQENDDKGSLNSIIDNIVLTQITDFVFPIPGKDVRDLSDGTVKVEDFYGTTGVKNSLNKRGQSYTYKDASYPFFDRDFVKNHSSKMASVLDEIDNTEGIVFVYTNFVESGITPLQLMLEHNGYKRFDRRRVLNFPEYKSSLNKHKCKREPMSYNGLRKSEAGDEFKQANFIVIDGSTNKKELSEQLNIISSKSNMRGERIKIILGTVVASEGLDFKRIRSIHILDPWVHLNRIEQTIGRGIRFCSHSDLDKKDRNVLTYLHAATLKNDKETIDCSIYRYAESKSLQIGLVETILKKNAIDRYLYESVNVIKQGSMNIVPVQPPIYQSKQITMDPTDKAYSKVCSYMPDCDYNNDITIDYDVELNKDTYFEEYSRNAIQNVKKKISLMYKDFYVFNIDSILGLMGEYGFNHPDMIYQALSEMISEKYIIHGKNNHTGYIINRYKYYIFQPFLYEDKFMPLQYRINISELPNKVIKLDKVAIVKDKPIFSMSYTLDSIMNVYTSSIDSDSIYQFGELIDRLKDIYNDISIFHSSVVEYFFDRLTFSDKCALIYAKLKQLMITETNYHEPMMKLVEKHLVYKTDSDEFYFGYENKQYSNGKLFGFYVTFQNKVYFYEYFDGIIQECDQVQMTAINKSLKRFKNSTYCKQYKKHSKLWGYTIWRNKKNSTGVYEDQVVLKFVPPNLSDAKYPPGPGNVCIENNLGSSKETIKKLIDVYLPELVPMMDEELMSNKRNICFVLELILRYKPELTLYPVDGMWMRYL